ncbi:uncharacterized protein Dwil_GK27673 [Drosophila willistoni]|uniref:Uncharacterized protein n=1 Tax=Drosophila willistoni TaxID=7260 RepID=A0A0Q9X2R5_DROWI|nr:uncharacterized protein Dwil_GK27673 [Drosophila willistoni]
MHSSAGGGGAYEDVAAARRGRFRVTSSSPQGPPETTLGRFRLIPTSNYGAISPILQRGRFAVIPEEPQASSPALGTPPPAGRTGGTGEGRAEGRSPSPEWDFDIDQVSRIDYTDDEDDDDDEDDEANEEQFGDSDVAKDEEDEEEAKLSQSGQVYNHLMGKIKAKGPEASSAVSWTIV